MTNAINNDFYFAQNLTAAQEGALIARLSRIKTNISKMKVALNAMDQNDPKIAEMEENLLVERDRYYNVLTQLNRVRSRNIRQELERTSERIAEETDKQIVSYYYDRDFYTPQFMSVTQDTGHYNYMTQTTAKFSSPGVSYKTNVMDTAGVFA